MAINLDIRLKRENKVYHEGDILTGLVVIDCRSESSHNGVSLSVHADATLQTSPKPPASSFYNSTSPLELLRHSCELVKAGKLPAGQIEVPFEVSLSQGTKQPLYETYHGVSVNIQYIISVEMKRSFLSKGIVKECEFMVERKPESSDKLSTKKLEFCLNSSKIQNLKGKSAPPQLDAKCTINSTICPINQPFTGKIQVSSSELEIRSIELQLMRVESVLTVDGFYREASEIQNIQIADGKVCKSLDIPIYMVFPRLFTRPSIATKYFKIEFEVNVVVVFENDYTVSEDIPIILYRAF